ncbi:hypothetical protein L1987_10535 [Smallanthus sonchifolius]|uniref:Uncharacterized protein n=1 Tax=Smallanthus sonchifolius TaxID=185202 RepID=A0ACB9JSQ0_9ASTR|nr:hypothetical protein L1987_10535 [Smallanthus sonchifolius]
MINSVSCLPSAAPSGLKSLREKELAILRGEGVSDKPREKKDRIYDYDSLTTKNKSTNTPSPSPSPSPSPLKILPFHPSSPLSIWWNTFLHKRLFGLRFQENVWW